MAQKILKVGSSAGVTIPKRVLESLGLRVGDRVSVDIDEKSGRLYIDPEAREKNTVDAELFQWTKRFIDTYRPALEELAKK